MYCPRIGKTYFAFGGVYVEVRHGRIDFHKDGAYGVASVGKKARKPVFQGLHKAVILYPPFVRENVLLPSVVAKQFRTAEYHQYGKTISHGVKFVKKPAFIVRENKFAEPDLATV